MPHPHRKPAQTPIPVVIHVNRQFYQRFFFCFSWGDCWLCLWLQCSVARPPALRRAAAQRSLALPETASQQQRCNFGSFLLTPTHDFGRSKWVGSPPNGRGYPFFYTVNPFCTEFWVGQVQKVLSERQILESGSKCRKRFLFEWYSVVDGRMTIHRKISRYGRDTVPLASWPQPYMAAYGAVGCHGCYIMLTLYC